MPAIEDRLKQFVEYTQKLIGDEKSEAQIFLDHLFQAFGFEQGIKDTDARLEERVKNKKKRTTSFADLVWKPRVLIEMKRSGVDLSVHYQQAFQYWEKLVPNRPRYVILCNFNEFWIYDLDLDVYEPQDVVTLNELPERYHSLSFMFPKRQEPVFVGKEKVTKQAAEKVAHVFSSLVNRRVNREDALRYCLQCIISMFAEDVKLLPNQIFTRLIRQCTEEKRSSYDLIGGLFREMNEKGTTPAGQYEGVDYFNGGLFEKVVPLELRDYEIELLDYAAKRQWQDVKPAIFGTIFESGLEKSERHVLGAHYTYELDIKKIVDPVIVQPWQRKIEAAETFEDYEQLLRELATIKILDPACGSGNFLFIAYKELIMIVDRIVEEIKNLSDTDRKLAKKFTKLIQDYPFISTQQFYGIDSKPYAVELAKVTLMIAKELIYHESKYRDFFKDQKPLPLDNLEENILCEDALLDNKGKPRQWPEADIIIGNPPYQSKNKMQNEFGADYLNKLRKAYPEIPGRADYVVYWFYKAHNHLKEGGYAGLVGTNTIRQNYSREGSLDYIVDNGGTIFNAVSSKQWSGEAKVYVSIVNWKKGEVDAPKTLITYENGEEKRYEVAQINSSLSLKPDVSKAHYLASNKKPKCVFQGQTHGHEGFLLSLKKGKQWLQKHPEYKIVLKPFLIGDELVANIKSQPERFVIDFTFCNQVEAAKYKDLYNKVKKEVLAEREKKAEQEENGEIKPNGHANQLKKWWKLWRPREKMLENIANLKRYIACARVTQRPIFEFISSEIRPNDKVMVFPFEDYYTFGVIQSSLHWQWFLEKCTTLAHTPNYNTASIWDTFPWPQNPSEKGITRVAEAARKLHEERTQTLARNNLSLRELYRILEQPGENPLKDLHQELDKAVIEVYGFDPNQDLLEQLLNLSFVVYEKEQNQEPVTKPGLPDCVEDREAFVSELCVEFEGNN